MEELLHNLQVASAATPRHLKTFSPQEYFFYPVSRLSCAFEMRGSSSELMPWDETLLLSFTIEVALHVLRLLLGNSTAPLERVPFPNNTPFLQKRVDTYTRLPAVRCSVKNDSH